LSYLPFERSPTLAAALADRFCFGDGGNGSVALRSVRETISRALRGAAEYAFCAVRNMRKPGIAEDFGGLCAWAPGHSGAYAGIAGNALRSVQA